MMYLTWLGNLTNLSDIGDGTWSSPQGDMYCQDVPIISITPLYVYLCNKPLAGRLRDYIVICYHR